MPLVPFDFQSEASDLAVQAVLAGENFLIVSPTGTGKSVILCDLYRKLRAAGLTVRMITSRDEIRLGILNDGVDMGLSRADLEHAVMGPIVFRNRMRKGIEAGGQRAPDVLLVDEAHHLLASSWSEPLIRNRRMRLVGTTATPMRGDPSETPQWRTFYDRFHSAISYVEAIKSEVLVNFHLVRGACGLLGGRMEGQSESAIKLATEHQIDGKLDEIFDLVMALERNEARPTLFAAPSFESAVKVAAYFTHRGRKTEVVSGKVRNKLRLGQFERSRDNSVWLVGVEIILEGINLPWISRAVCLRRSGALNPYAQFIGRALRQVRDAQHRPVKDRKPNAQVVDFTDNFPRFRERMRDYLGLEFLDDQHVWRPDLSKEPERRGVAVARDYVMYRFTATPSPSRVTGKLGVQSVEVECGVALDGDQWAMRVRGAKEYDGTWVLLERRWVPKRVPTATANYSVTVGGDAALVRAQLARIGNGLVAVPFGEVTLAHLLGSTLLRSLAIDAARKRAAREAKEAAAAEDALEEAEEDLEGSDAHGNAEEPEADEDERQVEDNNDDVRQAPAQFSDEEIALKSLLEAIPSPSAVARMVYDGEGDR